MSLTTAIATYFVLWWIVLFAVLPWGVRSQEESGTVVPGTDPGAPTLPRVWRKLFWTTIVSAVIFVLVVALYRYDIITFDKLAAWFGVT